MNTQNHRKKTLPEIYILFFLVSLYFLNKNNKYNMNIKKHRSSIALGATGTICLAIGAWLLHRGLLLNEAEAVVEDTDKTGKDFVSVVRFTPKNKPEIKTNISRGCSFASKCDDIPNGTRIKVKYDYLNPNYAKLEGVHGGFMGGGIVLLIVGLVLCGFLIFEFVQHKKSKKTVKSATVVH